jgi:hypothetical protein
MAQRTIHYLLGEELIPLGVEDVDRFRVGNLLPDAIEDLVYRDLTHYQREFEKDGKRMRFSDFERFRRDFAPRVERDGLYLGYYMHLVEDACYRIFWNRVRFAPRDMTRAQVAVLHNDYHLLNAYIVRNYCVRSEIVFPEGFESEPLNRIYPFLLRDFLEEMKDDFCENPQGRTRYLTEELLEDFLAEARPVCREALRRILAGEEPTDPKSLCW